MRRILFLLLLTYSFTGISQSLAKRVLFLGNSYTNRNNLPNLFVNVALSTGDTIIVDSNTPGGYTLQGHSTNQTSLLKIAQGSWDYVVLQEQSQRPSFPDSQVRADVYPYAKRLDSLIQLANPCSETVFYMTWGRKNGDASNCGFFPPLCTYQGMDSLLNLRYRYMADTNEAIVSPVGAVWNYIRTTYPNIELYTADESHPSLAGSYAAACTFYASILRKDPTFITFNSTLSAVEANQIKNAAKLIVFDSLQDWNVGKYDVGAEFSIVQNGFQVEFNGTLDTLVQHQWDFGDGFTDTVASPIHLYANTGYYTVIHTVNKCSDYDMDSTYVNLIPLGLNGMKLENDQIKLFPNPSSGQLTIYSDNNIVDKASVYSATGVLMLEKTDRAIKQIDLSGLEPGYYFVRLVLDNGGSSTKKVIIK
tara:strand:+ start:699 stop:1958 length:1260 start_codon:yes stop_codon:yes gene_type:complete